MDRWLPLGRDLEQTLLFYSYALAYIHKVIAWISLNISLYQITLYAPTVCFVFGLGVLLIFLLRAFGFLFSTVTGVLLTILPSAIGRSVAGFSDRDSWCLMLGIFAVTTYLTALQTQHRRARLLWTLASGFTMFLGGMSWEGFGIFGAVILAKGKILLPEHLPENIRMYQKRPVSTPREMVTIEDEQKISVPLGTTFKSMEKMYILDTLAWLDGNRTRTSQVLKIGIRTLQRKLKKYGV